MLKNVKCFISPIINITEHLMDWLFCRKLRMRLVYLICLGHGSDRPPRTDHRDLLSARVRSSPQFLRRPFVLPHRPPLVLPLLRFRSADSHILFYLWPNLFPLSCSGAQQKWRLFLSPAHTHTRTHTHTHLSSSLLFTSRIDLDWSCSEGWNIAADRKRVMRPRSVF